jgi:hypothetical protein
MDNKQYQQNFTLETGCLPQQILSQVFFDISDLRNNAKGNT